ncbi:MAG: hypothetical protein JSS86_01695 [Cyanobacteria bacterium SZAS LIN-2]|nr:hypothetical protein [Cyanobacteria bacterium SZAS LIN-3]MBS1994987.1 hypothetical protein [Cyanobacteria bacterium SZAS LIN-2]
MQNGSTLGNRDLIDAIEHAKDSVGVITQTALEKQLGSLSPADWRQAAAIFHKDEANPDGFYITDDADGKVTIHNDLTTAHKHADNSVLSATVDDAKYLAALGLGLDAWIAISYGGTKALIASGTASATGFKLAALAGRVGIAATASSAVTMAEVLGAAGGVVLAGDYVRNYYRKGTAQEDIRNAAEVSLNARKPRAF